MRKPLSVNFYVQCFWGLRCKGSWSRSKWILRRHGVTWWWRQNAQLITGRPRLYTSQIWADSVDNLKGTHWSSQGEWGDQIHEAQQFGQSIWAARLVGGTCGEQTFSSNILSVSHPTWQSMLNETMDSDSGKELTVFSGLNFDLAAEVISRLFTRSIYIAWVGFRAQIVVTCYR